MTIGDWALANPAGLWWWLLTLPVLALHVLRPRRVQAQVSAVYLWQRVTTPVSAARPWQRLIPSWLLAAQLLAVLLLGLLMARPVRLTDDLVADHTIFVIDASASMQATDGEPDRLALARDRARRLRDRLPEGGEATIIEAGTRARAVLTRSDDPDAFTAALDTVTAADTAGDVAAAFALAAGLDTGDQETRVLFVSDGGITAADLRAAPVGTRYEPVGSSATNRGITQFSVEPAGGGLVGRLSVAHFGGPEATQDLRIDVDGVTVSRRQVTLGPTDVVNLTVALPAGERFEAFLEGGDAYLLDDRVVATVARRRAVEVLWAGPDNAFLGAALAASPGVEVTRVDALPTTGAAVDATEDNGDTDANADTPGVDPAVLEGIDVVVAAGVPVPPDLDLPLLAIDPVGPVRGVEPTGTVEAPVVTLVDDGHPLLTGIDVSEVFVASAQRVEVPVGADVLLAAEGAPLLVRLDGSSPAAAPEGTDDDRAPTVSAPTLVLTFGLEDSTLPLEVAFPVLFDRALSDLSGAATPPARLTVGADLPLDPRLEATITSPEGTSETIAPGTAFPTADRIGFWRVEQPGRDPLTLAVAPDRVESTVAPAPDLPFEAAFGDQPTVEDRGRIPWLWPVILVLLAVLAAEYLLARRRIGVGRRQWRVATGLRVAVALALVLALIAPTLSRPADEVATVFLVDASDSMSAAGRARAAATVAEALAQAPDDTRAGVVVFGRDARLESLIAQDPRFDGVTVQVDRAGTDLAAALRLGAATLPGDARGRLVVLSDGRATTGDTAREAARLAADGVPVDVVVVEPPGGADVAVAGVDAPTLARQGEEVAVEARLVSPGAGPAVVSLRRDGDLIESRTVELAAGENTVRFTDVATGDGVLRYQVEVEGVGDAVAANDVGFAAVPVQGADRVLVIEGRAGGGEGLAAALVAGGLPVDVVGTGGVPPLDELAAYASVVLVDVDRFDLSDGQVQALSTAVRDLGRGLLVVGGTRSYALGGYRNSDLEDLLPVVSEITDPLRRQTVAEVLAIDTSGSMGACHCNEEGANGLGGGNRIDGGVSKTAIARTAAARAIAALSATDEVGVLSMDAADRWVIDLQAAPSQETVDTGLGELEPDGPTFVDTGLLTAAEALRESDASLKHIIFFSDGFTEPGALVTVEEQAAELLAEGITVSVVATGEGAADDLRPIAEAGGGRYYPGRNLQQIPELIVNEAVLASRDFVNEGEFLPVVTSGRAPVRTLSASPALLGYVATSAKATATVDLRIGPDQDPLLASWRAGLGRVTTWTSDGGERWSAPWAAWDGGPDFWAGVVKDTFPVAGDGAGVQARIVDDRLEITVEGDQDWPDDAGATARVGAPDGSGIEVVLERTGSRTFAATVPVTEAGTYAVGAVVTSRSADPDESIDAVDGSDPTVDGATVWAGVGLTTRSYPAEYAPRPVGRGPLVELASTTGGRVDAAAVDLFDPEGTRPGTRRFDLRPWLLLLATLTWPVAVAVSRLRWRRGALALGAERATDTVTELRRRLPRLGAPDLGPGRPVPGPAAGPGPTGGGPPTPPRPAGNPTGGGAAGPVTGSQPVRPVQDGQPWGPDAPSAPPTTGPAPGDGDGDGDGDSEGGSTVSELLARKRRRT